MPPNLRVDVVPAGVLDPFLLKLLLLIWEIDLRE